MLANFCGGLWWVVVGTFGAGSGFAAGDGVINKKRTE